MPYTITVTNGIFELILTKQRLLSLIKAVDFLKMIILNIMVIVLDVLMNLSTWVYYLNHLVAFLQRLIFCAKRPVKLFLVLEDLFSQNT